MTSGAPDPMVPAEVDLRDFPFTPVFRSRLFGSTFHAEATDAEWRAGFTLWLKSWDQVPAGTLPDSNVELCRLAELGRDLKTWAKLRAGALRGWVLCSDGRLHHKVVAEGVLEAWARKQDQRYRTTKARIAKLEKRIKAERNAVEKGRLEALLQGLSNELQQYAKGRPTNSVTGSDEDAEDVATEDATESVTKSVTDNVTATKRQGQGQGQGLNTNLKNEVGGSAAPAATTTGTDGLILAFDDALAATWGDGARRKQPHATDAETAQAWAAAGVTPETAARVCAEQFGQMRDRGAKTPWSLNAVTSDVLAAAAAPPVAEPITHRESPERAQWRKRLQGFARNEPWLTSWGAHPGDNACEAPPDLIAEVLPRLANTAQIVRMPSGRSKGK